MAKRLRSRQAFTLIELLVVISIISMLISILLPSLGRAREQGKRVHCLARLKEFGTALATYENLGSGTAPPALWYSRQGETTDDFPGESKDVEVRYGWMEILFTHLYLEEIRVAEDFPVMRNVEAKRWERYFLCKTVGDEGVSSGHYRVYLPAWSAGTFGLRPDGGYDLDQPADPKKPALREHIRPKLPLIGDANEFSERGDGIGEDECSYIDAAEANISGVNGGRSGNRFSDRHSGGTNYLFQDLHGEWSVSLRKQLARDFDLNGVIDIEEVP